MSINYLINELLNYGIQKEIMESDDFDYNANVLIDLFNILEFKKVNTISREIEDILEDLAIYAYENQIIKSNDVVSFDNFKAKIIDVIIDKPKTVIKKFYDLYKKSPNDATNYLYTLSKDTNYIQTKRISQNIIWNYNTEYGNIILTINLSKPEKDPKLIALQKNIKSNSYPECKLCKENQGYRGHINYDSRSNMRLIPLILNNEKWYFQYSPYAYFNEHSIVLNENHIPMKIDEDTFIKLLDFLDYFPDYFIGSNAGLPIVGGSILNHEHYQAGRVRFPIEYAKEEYIAEYDGVKVYKLTWPLSTIRIKSKSRNLLINLAVKILNAWKTYENKDLLIINSKDEIHNTITPISRKENNTYVFDLILRSNYTNDEYPDGVFHPHQRLHNIKKENIGLIEAMGLGVLPARLKSEFSLIKEILKGKDINNESLTKHKEWISYLKCIYINEQNVDDFINKEAGKVFSQVLKDCGVFKMNDEDQKEFRKFIDSIISNKAT